MNTQESERHMRTAIALAKKGRTSPNPQVGAVLVRDGRVIARGYHKKAGKAHAEVDAINKAGTSARGTTLIVTLEPCNHTGRTGPCTDAIIAAGIAQVILGAADPKPHVLGALEKLRAAGIEVQTGILEPACRELIADFATLRLQGRPFLTLKAGITLDGKTATASGESKWITGEASRMVGHELRAQSDAIICGVGTVLADNPQLTVRHVRGPQPQKIIVDTELRTPAQAALFESASKRQPVLLVHAADIAANQVQPWRRRKEVELLPIARNASSRGIDLKALLAELGRRNIMRMLVESGPRLSGSLFDLDLIDEVVLFIAPKIFGDPQAPGWLSGQGVQHLNQAKHLTIDETRHIGDDVFLRARIVR